MKVGANYLILSRLDVNIEDVKEIIFTFAGKTKVKKTYPSDDVSVDDGLFAIALYQEDTIALEGSVLVEAQINYWSGAVSKTDVANLYLSKTLNTEIVAGDKPSSVNTKDVKFQIVGNTIVAKIEGDIKPEDIEKAVNDYLSEHPIESGITAEECERIVEDYMAEHPVEPYDDTQLKQGLAQLSARVKELEDLINSGNIPSKPDDEPDTPSPDEPIEDEPVPQTGTWQLKTTTDKKYVIMGTDDDNYGNAKYFRLLRSYGFPYTMNVESENANTSRGMGSDVDDTFFTSSDAPALFQNGVDVITLGKYLHDNNLGEVAQHGASSDTLWDSSKLTGTFLDGIYSTYTAQGGTKSKDEFKTAIIEQKANSDVQNDAPYVEASRQILETTYGFPIYTVGAWGGSPSATIDGITVSLNAIKGGTYDWQGNNYYGASTYVATWHINKDSYDIARMNDESRDMTEYIDLLPYGKAVEFFWHVPLNDRNNVRGLMESLKALKDAGKIEVVTRYQYAQLGEYVSNPITSISVERDNIPLGETDTKSSYTVTATYKDGSTANVSNEAIIDNSSVNVDVAGSYTATAYYRGFSASKTVAVVQSYTVPDGLKEKSYWFVANNTTKGIMIAANTSGAFGTASRQSAGLTFTDCSDGKMNGWTSSDGGASWTQVNTNTQHFKNIKTNSSSGALMFGSNYSDEIILVESSGNFEWNYV